MKCPKCGAELPKNAEACPKCGARVGKKKLSKGATIVITIVLIALVAAAFGYLIYRHNQATKPADPTATTAVGQDSSPAPVQSGTSAQTPSDSTSSVPGTNTITPPVSVVPFTPEEGSYTYPAASVSEEMLQKVVATAGSRELTNAQLPFFYWYGIQNFYSNYSSLLGDYLDLSQPLDRQYYDSEKTITWQSYFLDMALNDFQYYAAMNQDAEKAGFVLPEAYQSYLDNLLDAMETTAVNYGYKDLNSYLQAFFSPYATPEGYLEFTRTYLTVNAYSIQLQQNLASEITMEELEKYYSENRETMEGAGVRQDGTRLVNVRHILISPEDTESEDDWKEASETAETLYNTWKNNPTEDYFSQLANNYSKDPGSSTTGGLYENVYPGQMVPEFNDWCFDPNRQVGDSAIVKTSYGYHIMYYAGQGIEYWLYASQNRLLSERYEAAQQEILNTYPLETDLDSVILVDPQGMY